MKNIYTFLVGVLMASIAFAQVIPIDSVQYISPADLAAGNDLSYKDGDTVEITGVVTMNPCLYGLSSGPNRVGTFVQAADGHAWGGVHVLIDPGVLTGYSGTVNDLDNDTKFIDNFTVGSTVTCKGIVTNFADNTQVALVPEQTTATAGGLTDTVVLTIDQFVNTNGDRQETTGEQWEGIYVEFRNVGVVESAVSGSDPDRWDLTVSQGAYRIRMRDISGHFRNDDQDKFCSGSSETPTPYNFPAVGTFLAYVRGVIVQATVSGTDQYMFTPITPSDIGPATQALPVVQSISINPKIPSSTQSVDVTAKITDGDGTIDSARLYYSIGVGNMTFNSVMMSDQGNDNWLGTIPATNMDSSYVNYWVKAFDNDTNYVNYPDSLATNSVYWVKDGGITEISHIQFTPRPDGSSLFNGDSLPMNITGIVTATNESYDLGTAVIQSGTDPWGGIHVWGSETNDWKRGDEVNITAARIQEHFDEVTELSYVTATVVSSGNALPGPITGLDIDMLATDQDPFGESYEGMFLRFDNVTVVDINADDPDNYGEWMFHTNGAATQGLRVDDESNDFPFGFNDDSLTLGQNLGYIQGILNFSFSAYKLNPRNLSDIDGFVTQFPKRINTFSIDMGDTTVFGSINQNDGTIAINVAQGSDVTALDPTIEFDGESVSPAGAQDFTNPVTYTVTAPVDASTKDYVVTVGFYTTGVAENASPLEALTLYPNPTQGNLNVSLSITESGTVTTTLFNLLGEQVKTSNQLLGQGKQQFNFDMKGVADGVYLLEVKGDNFKQTRKVTVIK